LDSGILKSVADVFKPQTPVWACEITSQHVIAAGVGARRTRITDKWAAEMPAAVAVAGARPAIRDVLNQVGFNGSEIVVVVPDEVAKISLLTAENPSRNVEEQHTFIRWKLKKTIPFDVDTAQVAYKVLGPHNGGTGVDMLVVLSPRSTVHEYETLFESMDIHAGMILPSTLAAMNLLHAPAGDALFVKVAPDCITTTVFQNRRVQFYRRVTDSSMYDAVYPTLMYYQDKLGGKALEQLFVCGYGQDLSASLEEIHQKLGLAAQRLEPKGTEDIFKPVLGAVHFRAEAALHG
jgi:type IV pilus assembly protein PilM